jgi:hypothetical protein
LFLDLLQDVGREASERCRAVGGVSHEDVLFPGERLKFPTSEEDALQITCRLPADYLQITCRLPADYLQITSHES